MSLHIVLIYFNAFRLFLWVNAFTLHLNVTWPNLWRHNSNPVNGVVDLGDVTNTLLYLYNKLIGCILVIHTAITNTYCVVSRLKNVLFRTERINWACLKTNLSRRFHWFTQIYWSVTSLLLLNAEFRWNFNYRFIISCLEYFFMVLCIV